MTPIFTYQEALFTDRAPWFFRTERVVVRGHIDERIIPQNHDRHLASSTIAVKSRTKLAFIRFSDVNAGSDAFRTGACGTWSPSAN
jgi:hypothetical protein